MIEQERASWLWERLRRALPKALSCVLMREHLHLEALPGRKMALRDVLDGYTRTFGVRLDLADPEPANSPAILFRQIRYGVFNPYREGLVDDPWRWRWSTLRDLGGACDPVWTPLSRVASAVGLSPHETLRRLTSTADFHAPVLKAPSLLLASLDAVRVAVASALRCAEDQVLRTPKGRRLVIQTCFAIGQPRPAQLAAELGCGVRTIHRARKQPNDGVDAVLRCLADQRLLQR